MKRTFLSIIPYLCLSAFICGSVAAQSAPGLVITAPQSGQVIQGLAVISGSVTLLGFSYYELAFSYENDPTGTWFLLQANSLPVTDGELGVWDTSAVTDGDYRLRLRAYLLDGSFQEVIVTNLHVRNYTAVPTATPTATEAPIPGLVAPTALLATPVPVSVTQAYPTPTPLPPNPASLSPAAIYSAVQQGALWTLAVFLGIGLFLRLRRD